MVNSDVLLRCFPCSYHLFTGGSLLLVSAEYTCWLLYLCTQQPTAGVVLHATDVTALRYCPWALTWCVPCHIKPTVSYIYNLQRELSEELCIPVEQLQFGNMGRSVFLLLRCCSLPSGCNLENQRVASSGVGG